jgi:hypothetical protein
VAAYRSVAPIAPATSMDTDIAKMSSSAKRNAKNESQQRSRGAKRTSSDSAPLGSPPLRRLRSNQTIPPSSGNRDDEDDIGPHIRIGPDYQAFIPARDFVYSHSESSEDQGDVSWYPSLVPIIQAKACSLISHLAVDARNQSAIFQLPGLEYILREMANYTEDYDIQTAALDALGFLFSNNEDIQSIVKNDVVVAIGRALGNFSGDEKVAFQKKAFDVLSRMLPSRHPQDGIKINKTT